MTQLYARSILKQGDVCHVLDRFNADGTPMRCRVTSIKTWKRDPERIEVRVARGLYEHAIFDQHDLDRLHPGDGRDYIPPETQAPLL